MKILFYIESLRSGGKERRLVELIKGINLNYPFIKVTLVLIKNEIHYTEILDLGLDIFYTERKYSKKDPLVFFKFLKIVKKVNPDIIHVWGNMAAIYAIPAKLFYKKTLINNEIADAPLSIPKRILNHRLTFPFSDKIIANSHAGIKIYSPDSRKSKVIHNGFNFSRIENLENATELRHKFNINTEFVIGMVASFNEFKDYDTYIKAANLVLTRNKKATFLCIGSGDYLPYKESIPEENTDYIKFLGKQTNVESIENICDIGVLTTFGEGIPNAIMEFMALGKPVIATNLGGCPELIRNNYNGFLIEPFDAKGLADKIEYLLNQKEERIKLGNRGTEVISQSFNINDMVRQFVDEYRNIIKN